jgi:hypothetical protein
MLSRAAAQGLSASLAGRVFSRGISRPGERQPFVRAHAVPGQGGDRQPGQRHESRPCPEARDVRLVNKRHQVQQQLVIQQWTGLGGRHPRETRMR